jgi:hypothetical protein
MRVIILIIVAFVAGFLIRDYIGPVRLPVSIRTIQDAVVPSADTESNIPGNVDIIYLDGKFTPSEAVIAVGRWVTITNKTDSHMWLSSDNPWLSTSRGYSRSERVRVRMDDVGTYHVTNKNNLNATITIRVVP